MRVIVRVSAGGRDDIENLVGRAAGMFTGLAQEMQKGSSRFPVGRRMRRKVALVGLIFVYEKISLLGRRNTGLGRGFLLENLVLRFGDDAKSYFRGWCEV